MIGRPSCPPPAGASKAISLKNIAGLDRFQPPPTKMLISVLPKVIR